MFKNGKMDNFLKISCIKKNGEKPLLEGKLSVWACHLHETAVRAETDTAAATRPPQKCKP